MRLFTVSNSLSLLRGPLALLFFFDSILLRSCALFCAISTDILDGYLARRLNGTSRIGAVLDPLMDKLFVFFAISIFLYEEKILLWQAISLLSRDFAILLFGLYLFFKKRWVSFRIRSIWTGKVTTTLQFLTLAALIIHLILPNYWFAAFILLGVLAFLELFLTEFVFNKSKKLNLFS